ncbi:uncharacterized protein LOC143035152 [Oratosquilla oratoria]|uniref:uncharacterized protein LOC143035152 n=1 Tax=Oratosquilla oratoria TaxID=337810 RepID=UPI003F75DFF2
MMDTALNNGKYSLRTKSILKRIESEKNRQCDKKKEPKTKQKPPPLSKYRRKTANARERNRMREINDAFVTLQEALPSLPCPDAEKLTKITVLKLAVNYIKALANVLDTDNTDTEDIDMVREQWCVENAHMAQPEHCVKAFKASALYPPHITPPSTGKTVATAGKHPPSKKNTNMNTSKPKNPNHKSKNDNKIKSGDKQNIRKKNPKQSTKKCKTTSVNAGNGTYIVLKNVALPTTRDSSASSLATKPMRIEQFTLSKATKRPRLEPFHHIAPVTKIAKLESPEPLVALTASPAVHTPASLSWQGISEPLVGTTPFTMTTSLEQNHNIQPPSSSTVTCETVAFKDLESPVVRNDVLLEFPQGGRFKTELLSSDSAFSSDASEPPSPSSGSSGISPSSSTGSLFILDSPIGRFSPTTSSLSTGISSDSNGSILETPLELGSLLGDEPFEEELDHLTSSFAEGDDSFELFLDHSSSNFICTDIDEC